MLHACGFNRSKNLKLLLWEECANMTTQVSNIIASDLCEQCSYEKVHGRLPIWCVSTNLHAFSEVFVMDNRSKIMRKFTNRGEFEIMVGYSDQHYVGTCRIFLIMSQITINTRDVKCLNQHYGDWMLT